MVVNLSLKFEYEEKVIGSINSYHNLLTSVHDLKPILKILGIKANLHFNHYSQISVTILDFI